MKLVACEDNIENKDALKKKDDSIIVRTTLKNEDHFKREDNLKLENNLKIKTTTKIKMTPR